MVAIARPGFAVGSVVGVGKQRTIAAALASALSNETIGRDEVELSNHLVHITNFVFQVGNINQVLLALSSCMS